MKPADQPPALPVRLVASIDPAIDVLLHFGETEQAAAGFIEDHGRQVMVQQGPPAFGVGSSLEKHLEGIVSGHPDPATPSMTQQMIEFSSPLGMRSATKAEPIPE